MSRALAGIALATAGMLATLSPQAGRKRDFGWPYSGEILPPREPHHREVRCDGCGKTYVSRGANDQTCFTCRSRQS